MIEIMAPYFPPALSAVSFIAGLFISARTPMKSLSLLKIEKIISGALALLIGSALLGISLVIWQTVPALFPLSIIFALTGTILVITGGYTSGSYVRRLLGAEMLRDWIARKTKELSNRKRQPHFSYDDPLLNSTEETRSGLSLEDATIVDDGRYQSPRLDI